MKPTIAQTFSRRWLGVGMLLAAAVAAEASTAVTFSVDMNPVGGAPTTVLIKGTFNGWGNPDSLAFTNDGANVWSQTVIITDPPGTVETCKFFYDGNWEGDPNRQFILDAGTQVLPLTSWNVKDWPAPTNMVTFQVDLSAQTLSGDFIPGQTVGVAGDFENWDNAPTPGPFYLTNNPMLPDLTSNIYSGTFPVVGIPPVSIKYKFRANGGWESPTSTGGDNRSATITNASQVLPLVYYNDIAPNSPTNWVTLQVDMSAQTLLGAFAPGQNINVSGGFTSWGDGLPMTNNPTLPDLASNIYSVVVPIVGYRPIGIAYKFRMNGGWENDQNTPTKNREATITSSNQILPLVFYNNNDLYDLAQSDTAVTFTLYLPNGALDSGGVPFAKGVDSVYVNGTFFAADGSLVRAGTGAWWTWNTGFGGSQSAANQLFEVGSSDYYTNSLLMIQGSSLYLTYKYSVNGYDDENGKGTNHLRLIRSSGPTYTLPVDSWSWSLPAQPEIMTPGSNGIVEVDFGYLAAGKPAGGKVPISWLGRPGVVLQNKSNLGSGSWTDNNGTDATMSTNWPAAGSSQFFRLKKK